MFGWLRNLAAKVAGRSGPDARLTQIQDRYSSLKAKYDAAQTNDDNRRHWANADQLSAAAANALPVRQFLRSRSRYEYDNGSYCSGIIRTRADDLVGTGPTLQILTDDDSLNEQIETAFSSWCRACRFAEKLHTMDQARNRDGEAFAVLVTNPKLKNPVKLDLELVECDRVTDPNLSIVPPLVTPTGQPMRLDGIEYDASGNPIAYHILDHHPGDFLGAFPMQARRVSAEYVLHWFRKDRPGQLRGVPELTPALPLFPYLRRWTLATLAAAETAADFAIVLETVDPGTVDATPRAAAPFSTVELERNLGTELPTGVTAKQLAAEHPNQNYETFKREILAECGRPVRMPVNVVAADSSKHNFSSGKLDHYGYRGGLRVDRHYTEINHLDHVFEEFVAEASRIPGLLPAGVDVLSLKRAWYWPGWASMDKDDAKNDTERLNNGTATLQEILAEWNIDWKESIRQRGRELAYMAEQGVPPPPSGGGGGLGGGGASSSGTSGSDGGGAVGGSGVIDVAALRGAILNGNGRAH